MLDHAILKDNLEVLESNISSPCKLIGASKNHSIILPNTSKQKRKTILLKKFSPLTKRIHPVKNKNNPITSKTINVTLWGA